MKPFPRLISTDFDGTIVDWDRPPHVSADFFAIMRDLQQKGAIWTINTGRSILQLEQALLEMPFTVQPDYIITLERAVHRRGDGGWEDFGDWNRRCTEAHARLHEEAREIFAEITAYAARQRGLMAPQVNGVLEGLIAINETQMDEAEQFIRGLQTRLPDLNFQRNGVYLRLCHIDYHKGSALAELSQLLGFEPGEIFAAGDNSNDLPMLDGLSAHWTACPINALPTVKVAVRQTGGFVSGKRAGDGVAESLRAFPWR